MSSPTQRSLATLRGAYELVDVVERWIPGANIRKDFCGIGDLIAIGPGVAVIQTTSDSNVSARVHKIAESDALPALQRAGVKVFVHGWKKVKGRWQLRIVEMA
jgi:hypothetical protein